MRRVQRADRRLHLPPPLDFLQHLWALNHALERTSLQMKRRLGITAQQRLLIRCIGQVPGLTASHLARVLHLDRGTVSVGLRRLEAMRLVTRRRDPSDRRRVSLDLTRRGRALNRPEAATVESAVERLIAAVSRRDLERTEAVLCRLTGHLQRDWVPQVKSAGPTTAPAGGRGASQGRSQPVTDR